MSDVELSFARIVRLDDERRLRNLAAVALLVAVLPVDLTRHGGLWPWDLLAISSRSDALRLLAPGLLGLGLLVLVRLRSLTRLGLGILGLALFVVCGALSTRYAFGWDEAFVRLLSFVGRQPLPVLGGLTLVALGASLRLREGSGRLDRWLLATGAGLLLALYALPQRGEPFAVRLLAPVEAFLETRQTAILLTHLHGWLLGLFPLFLAAWALLATRSRARTGMLGSMARYGLSGLVVLLCYRMATTGFGVPAVLVELRAALILALIIGVASTCAEAVLLHLLHDTLTPLGEPPSQLARDVRLRDLLERLAAVPDSVPADRGPVRRLFALAGAPPSHPWLRWLMRRRLAELGEELDRPFAADEVTTRAYLERLRGQPTEPAVALPGALDRPPLSGRGALWLATGRWRLPVALGLMAAVGALGLGLRVARSQPDLAWTLRPAGEAETRLFADDLPSYVLALSVGNTELAGGKGAAEAAEAAADLAERGEAMVEAARDLDPRLGEAVRELVERVDQVDLEGRLWMAAVRELNAAIRAAGLPFFLDPAYVEQEVDRRPLRAFLLVAYRVDEIRRRSCGGHEYAALHVRRVDALPLGAQRLGWVMRGEPFALVVRDAIAEHAAELAASLLDDGGCGLAFDEGDGGGTAEGLRAEVIDASCGAVVRALLAERGVSTGPGADREAVASELEAAIVASTETHEVQHQIDGQDIRVPERLFHLVPMATDSQLSRSALELSAFAAELGGDDALGGVTALALVTGHVLTPWVAQSLYRYAAGVLLGALTGAEIIAPLGEVDSAELDELWKDLAADPPRGVARLAERARRVQDELVDPPCVQEPMVARAARRKMQ